MQGKFIRVILANYSFKLSMGIVRHYRTHIKAITNKTVKVDPMTLFDHTNKTIYGLKKNPMCY